MRKIKSLLLLLLTFFGHNAICQTAMADRFYEEGKIYVVICVIVIIFICLGIYLFSIDRKISRIEKDLNSK